MTQEPLFNLPAPTWAKGLHGSLRPGIPKSGVYFVRMAMHLTSGIVPVVKLGMAGNVEVRLPQLGHSVSDLVGWDPIVPDPSQIPDVQRLVRENREDNWRSLCQDYRLFPYVRDTVLRDLFNIEVVAVLDQWIELEGEPEADRTRP